MVEILEMPFSSNADIEPVPLQPVPPNSSVDAEPVPLNTTSTSTTPPFNPPALADLLHDVKALLPDLSFIPFLSAPKVTEWSLATVLQGVVLAWDGSKATLRTSRTRRTLWKTLLYLVLVTATLVITTHAVFLPLRLAHAVSQRLVRPVLGSTVVRWLDYVMEAIDRCISWFLVATPDAGLYLVRYMFPGPLDKLFFEALRGLPTPTVVDDRARFVARFAGSLEPSAVGVLGGRRSWTLRLSAYLKRYAKRILMLIPIYLISKIPLAGFLIWPLATFVYLGLAVGWNRAAILCGAGLVSPPWWKFVRGPLLRGIWSFRSLERELIEPYLCRSIMTKSEVSQDLRNSGIRFHDVHKYFLT
ncbi:hypothetical protein HKX48_008603 [Thoreauomyces humboldtii]|nr:hypothetical protein HKX48_008603 [Thoreauomyces humboldtii]